MLNQITDARVTVSVNRGCVAIRSEEMYDELILSKADAEMMIRCLQWALGEME